MITAAQFRKIALSFPEAIESAHMGHPDFRVRGKVFATLHYPDKDSAVVKLTVGEQKQFVQAHPQAFRPVKGAWGQRGYTSVHLPNATIGPVREALTAAWRNTARKRLRLALADRRYS